MEFFVVKKLVTEQKITEQESPPAWTQEAYRPRRIKYLLSYPGCGGGTGGTPSLARVPPILTWMGGGVTPFCSDLARSGVPPILTWDQSLGYLPERIRDQWKYYGMEMGYPPPPPRFEQTANMTSRLVLRTRSVKTLVTLKCLKFGRIRQPDRHTYGHHSR